MKVDNINYFTVHYTVHTNVNQINCERCFLGLTSTQTFIYTDHQMRKYFELPHSCAVVIWCNLINDYKLNLYENLFKKKTYRYMYLYNRYFDRTFCFILVRNVHGILWSYCGVHVLRKFISSFQFLLIFLFPQYQDFLNW